MLINAAGVLPTGSVLDLTDEDLDHVLAVNLKAPLHGAQSPGGRDASSLTSQVCRSSSGVCWTRNVTVPS